MSAPAQMCMTEVFLPAGQEWLNQRNGWRFIRITSGAAYWMEQAAPRALNPGELVVVHPKAEALIRASQLNVVVLHAFEFVVDMLCGFFSLSERRVLEGDFKDGDGRTWFFPATHTLSERIGSLVGPGGHSGPGPGLIRRAELLLAVMYFFCDRA